MYGILRVDPKGYEPADKEYFMTVKEWGSRRSRMYAGEDAQYDITNRRPDMFTVTARARPACSTLNRGRP